jgi:hypothetical protein
LGVLGKVDQNLAEETLVELDRGEVGIEMGADFDPGLLGLRAVKVDEFADNRVEVRRFELETARPDELEEVVEDALERATFFLEELETLEHPAVARRFGFGEVLDQQVKIQAEDGEGVADFVDERAGEGRKLGKVVF